MNTGVHTMDPHLKQSPHFKGLISDPIPQLTTSTSASHTLSNEMPLPFMNLQNGNDFQNRYKMYQIKEAWENAQMENYQRNPNGTSNIMSFSMTDPMPSFLQNKNHLQNFDTPNSPISTRPNYYLHSGKGRNISSLTHEVDSVLNTSKYFLHQQPDAKHNPNPNLKLSPSLSNPFPPLYDHSEPNAPINFQIPSSAASTGSTPIDSTKDWNSMTFQNPISSLASYPNMPNDLSLPPSTSASVASSTSHTPVMDLSDSQEFLNKHAAQIRHVSECMQRAEHICSQAHPELSHIHWEQQMRVMQMSYIPLPQFNYSSLSGIQTPVSESCHSNSHSHGNHHHQHQQQHPCTNVHNPASSCNVVEDLCCESGCHVQVVPCNVPGCSDETVYDDCCGPAVSPPILMSNESNLNSSLNHIHGLISHTPMDRQNTGQRQSSSDSDISTSAFKSNSTSRATTPSSQSSQPQPPVRNNIKTPISESATSQFFFIGLTMKGSKDAKIYRYSDGTLHRRPESPKESDFANGVYRCYWENCNMVYESTYDLMEHLTHDHLGSSRSVYECRWKDCHIVEPDEHGNLIPSHRSFVQRQKAVRHLQAHTGHKPFKCTMCKAAFTEKTALEQHIRAHTNDRRCKCTYPGCNKSFVLASALTNHMRIHTGEKPFVCKFPGCTQRFTESSNLGKHMRTHATEKHYKCDICSRAFARSDQLHRHKMSMHKKQQPAKN